ncbi:glycosyltransferase [Escherichia coli]
MNGSTVVILQNSIKTTASFRIGYIYKLLADGAKVKVIAPNDCQYSKERLTDLGVDVLCTENMQGFGKFISYTQLNMMLLKERLVNKNNIYVCHFVSTLIIFYITLVPFNRHLCVYVEGLGSIFGRNIYLQKFLRFLVGLSSGSYLFCNAFEKASVGRAYDVVTGGIGINLCDFDYEREESDPQMKHLLYVGRLIEDKGVSVAIKTFEELSKSMDVTLHLVGDIYINNPTSLSERDINNFKDRFGELIQFHGYQTDLRKFYSKADVLLLPSKLEGFPVCVMEASAVGVPSVCFNVPGCRDAISEGINGFLSQPFLLDEYIQNVREALSRSREMKSRCRQYAKRKFDREEKDRVIISTLKGLKYRQ